MPVRRPGAMLLLSVASGIWGGCATGTDGLRTPTHDHPPRAGERLRARALLLRCDTDAAAIAASESGFIAGGCRLLEPGGDWQVVTRYRRRLEEGDVWLIGVERDGQYGVVPLPWHDWA